MKHKSRELSYDERRLLSPAPGLDSVHLSAMTANDFANEFARAFRLTDIPRDLLHAALTYRDQRHGLRRA